MNFSAHEKFPEKDVISASAVPSEEVNIGDCLYKPDKVKRIYLLQFQK
jgi:hypothetical protein